MIIIDSSQDGYQNMQTPLNQEPKIDYKSTAVTTIKQISNPIQEAHKKQRTYEDLNNQIREFSMCFNIEMKDQKYQVNIAIAKDGQATYWIDDKNSRKPPLSEAKQIGIAAGFGGAAIISNMFTGQGVATKILAANCGSLLMKPLSSLTTIPAFAISSVATVGLSTFDSWWNAEIMPQLQDWFEREMGAGVSNGQAFMMATGLLGFTTVAFMLKKAAKNMSQGKLSQCCLDPRGLVDWWRNKSIEELFFGEKITLSAAAPNELFKEEQLNLRFSRHPINGHISLSLYANDQKIASQDVIVGAGDDDDDEDEDDVEKTGREKSDNITETEVPKETKIKKKKKKEPPKAWKKLGVVGALTAAVAGSEYYTGEGITTAGLVGLESMLLKLEARKYPLANSLATLTVCGILLSLPRFYLLPWLNLDVIALATGVNLLRKHIKDNASGKPTKNSHFYKNPEWLESLLWNVFSRLPAEPPTLPLDSSKIKELAKKKGKIPVTLPDLTETKLKVISGLPRLVVKAKNDCKKSKEKKVEGMCNENMKESIFLSIMLALTLSSSYFTQQQTPTANAFDGKVQSQNQGETVLTSVLYGAIPSSTKQLFKKFPLSASYLGTSAATALALALENYLAKHQSLPMRFAFIPTGILIALLTKNLKTWSNGKGYGTENDYLVNKMQEASESIVQFFASLKTCCNTPQEVDELDKMEKELHTVLAKEKDGTES